MDNNNISNPIGEENSTGKTFTQDDVNRIIGERLAKEKAKSEQALKQREQELNQRELTIKAKEVLSSKGLPVDLLEAINYSDEETLNKSISIIEKYAKNNIDEKPIVKGREPIKKTLGISDQSKQDEAIRRAMGLKGV